MLMKISIDWRVLLAALIITIISATGRAAAQTVDHNIVFRDVGRVHQASATIHLTFRFNIGYLPRQCDKLEVAMQEQVRTILGPSPASLRRPWHSIKRTFNTTCRPIQAWRTQGRPKRQLGMIIAGAVITGELLFDVYRQNQLHHLQQQLRHATDISNRQILVLQHQGTRLDHLEVEAEQQGHELNELLRERQENRLQAIKTEWTEELQTHIIELGTQARSITRGLRALEHGHLSPHLLDDQQAQEAYLRVQRQAQQLGGRLLTDHHTDLYQLPTSFSVEDGTNYTAIVHVPVITESFDLLHFRSLPFKLSNGTQTITVEVVPQKPLLAYNAQLHQELDLVDLQQCWRRERDHICSDLGANQLQLRRTCLGALYTGEPEPIRARCALRNSTVEWTAEIIDDSSVIVYSDIERRAQIQCPNGSRSSLLIKGAQTISLSAGCLFTTDTISLRTRTDVLLPPVMVTRVAWDLDQFLQGDQLRDVIPAADDDDIRDHYVAPSSHQQQEWRDELRHLREQHLDDHASHSFALVIILGVILLLLIVAALVIARWTYIRTRIIQQAAPERSNDDPYRCGTGADC
jgi:hypothetical protein